jgi:UDP-galactopyranose mutase
LDGIEVRLGEDYLADKESYHALAEQVIYTGPIDAYFGYEFGELEYKTTRFDHVRHEYPNHQGVAVMNYTDEAVPYTRIIEHKHFEFNETPATWISYEYPEPYEASKTEPYYPVNDASNNALFERYKSLAAQEKNVFFGGRLGEYKYYDMHQIIERALSMVEANWG